MSGWVVAESPLHSVRSASHAQPTDIVRRIALQTTSETVCINIQILPASMAGPCSYGMFSTTYYMDLSLRSILYIAEATRWISAAGYN